MKERKAGSNSSAQGSDAGDSYKMLHEAASSEVNLAGRILRMLNLASQ